MASLSQLLSAFPLQILVHLASLISIVFFLYQRRSGSKEFCFSYIAIGAVVFALCFLLERVELELGFALGLFAIFGIIRYRTITIPIKEMTYLFVIIGISVINALADGAIPITLLIAANIVIFACLTLLEIFTINNSERSIIVRYERIENLRAGQREALLSDLVHRLGIEIKDVRTESVDFMRDTADLRVYFVERATPPETHTDALSPITPFSDR